MGLCFRAGRPFWDSILVIPFLGLHFGGGPFLGLRFGAGGRFWGSILVPVVRFGAPSWCQWLVLGLHFGAGGPFWGSILGLHFGAGGPFWGSIVAPVAVLGLGFGSVVRFWGSVLVPLINLGWPCCQSAQQPWYLLPVAELAKKFA